MLNEIKIIMYLPKDNCNHLFIIYVLVCKELQHVNYNDDKYKLDNEIVSKSNAYFTYYISI